MKKLVWVFLMSVSMVYAQNSIFSYLDNCSPKNYAHIKEMLKKEKNLKIYDKNGDTLLTKIAKKLQNCSYNQELSKLIIDKDRELLDMPNKEGDTPLIAAIREGKDIYLPRLFIKEGADVNKASKKDGKTALMLAVLNDDKELVRILSERFAKRGAKDTNGKSALEYAINKGDIKIIQKVYADKRGKFAFLDSHGKPLFLHLTKRGFFVKDKKINSHKILFAYVDKKIYKKLCQKKLKGIKVLAMISFDEKMKDFDMIKCKKDIKLLRFNEEFYKLLLKALRWRTPPMFLLRDKNGNIIASGIDEKFLGKI